MHLQLFFSFPSDAHAYHRAKCPHRGRATRSFIQSSIACLLVNAIFHNVTLNVWFPASKRSRALFCIGRQAASFLSLSFVTIMHCPQQHSRGTYLLLLSASFLLSLVRPLLHMNAMLRGRRRGPATVPLGACPRGASCYCRPRTNKVLFSGREHVKTERRDEPFW